MKSLLIDIGNSRIKICIAERGSMSTRKTFIYRTDNFEDILTYALDCYRGIDFYSVWISRLDEEKTELLKVRLEKLFKTSVLNFVDYRTKTPLRIRYASTLGSDRLCSAVSAYTRFGRHKNILVFDFGTATTVNFIANGVYKGGMITAGLMTAADSLKRKTTLPRAVLSEKASPENNTTRNAIASGLILQQVYFADKTIEAYRKKYGEVFTVATGGNLKYLKKYLKQLDAIDDNLVLEGLNIIRNFNEHIQ